MDIKTLMEAEIEERLNDLKEMEVGTDEHEATLNEIAKLVDRKIEMDKLDVERADKIELRQYEIDLKERQMKEEKTGRWTRDITNWVNLGIGAGLLIWGTFVSINFEREGTFTTTAGRKNVQRVLSWFK